MDADKPLSVVSLDDKYTVDGGQIFISGVQALVRLPLAQKRRDRAAGLNTGGYISGYRGSPLGTYDDQLRKAGTLLSAHDIVFQPGVNEDLAATAVWGSQQSEASGEGRFDGVFAIWYGKGPGVDRSGDAFRHGNLAGSSPNGGVLVLMGDDHTCESSTTCHQSEFALVDAMMPILSPAGVQEIIDFGLAGWALSRASGCWVGLKCVKDTVDATAVIDVDEDRLRWQAVPSRDGPPDGVHLRLSDTPHAQEARLHRYKLPLAQAWVRTQGLDRVLLDSPTAQFGVVAAGKSYLDVREALALLELSESRAEELGMRLYKPALVWPLEPHTAKKFATGLESILVVEEKRGLIEPQLKELMYGEAHAPKIEGKKDREGAVLFQAEMSLDPLQVAIALGERLARSSGDEELARRVQTLRVRRKPVGSIEILDRRFYFCSGCPHNSSTVLPEGSRGYAGIGCSWMAQFMGRATQGYTQMGAEGLSWVGESPFSRRKHLFQNMGDGTYFHSGLLAIRAAVAAKTNITFKILFNDAVAMTGGQRHDGPLNVPVITRQVASEGVKRIAVVTDEPNKYADVRDLSPGTTVHHRDDIQQVQRALREVDGATVLVYDQTCAAEKRRRRKRNLYPDPAKRLVIHPLVCEGCGDCGAQSNCVSLVPLETEFGRKRAIDQSSCNKDYSCVKGFCPSFVTVLGGSLKKSRLADDFDIGALPSPSLPSLERPYSLLVTGVGGTGVVTIGAVLGMAAHLEGKGCGILDMAGLAQKGGSVWSHVRFSAHPGSLHAIRIAPGGADALLGGDLVVSSHSKTLAAVSPGHTRALVNAQEVMPGDFARQPDLEFPGVALRRRIAEAVGEGNAEFVDAGGQAATLLGDSIASNMYLLGCAYQRGLIPVGAAAILRAIELNGTAVRLNQLAFNWGRRSVIEPAAISSRIDDARDPATQTSRTLEELIKRRFRFLVRYQDEEYAERYRTRVEQVRRVEADRLPGSQQLTEAVARNYFKLLAYKDEYEVARLYTDEGFLESLERQFEGDYRFEFNLAPPLLSRIDPATGRPRKIKFGPWIVTAFRILARCKRLRGTVFDPFGYTAERREERALIAEYERDLEEVLRALNQDNAQHAVQLASVPERIRGFGPVKSKNLAEARARKREIKEILQAVNPAS